MTIKTLRRRLDRLESNQVGKLPVLLLWDYGDDPDIKRQTEIAKSEDRQVMVLRWKGGSKCPLSAQ